MYRDMDLNASAMLNRIKNIDKCRLQAVPKQHQHIATFSQYIAFSPIPRLFCVLVNVQRPV